MTEINRALLREPFDNLRQALLAQGVVVEVTPMAADQIRAAFRMDLTQAGIDTGEPEQIAAALAGLAISVKMLGILGVATTPVVAQFVGLFDVVFPILDEDFDEQINAIAKSWGVPIDDDLPDLPKVPTADKPVVTDMTGWARALAGAQPDLHMTPEEIVKKAEKSGQIPGTLPGLDIHGRPIVGLPSHPRPTIGGPGFQRGPDDPGPCPGCGHRGGGHCLRCTKPDDDDEIVDAEIVDPHEDEESWPAPGASEPRRAQRRSWWNRDR